MELRNLTKMNLKKKIRKKERKDSKFEIKVTKKKKKSDHKYFAEYLVKKMTACYCINMRKLYRCSQAVKEYLSYIIFNYLIKISQLNQNFHKKYK